MVLGRISIATFQPSISISIRVNTSIKIQMFSVLIQSINGRVNTDAQCQRSSILISQQSFKVSYFSYNVPLCVKMYAIHISIDANHLRLTLPHWHMVREQLISHCKASFNLKFVMLLLNENIKRVVGWKWWFGNGKLIISWSATNSYFLSALLPLKPVRFMLAPSFSRVKVWNTLPCFFVVHFVKEFQTSRYFSNSLRGRYPTDSCF